MSLSVNFPHVSLWPISDCAPVMRTSVKLLWGLIESSQVGHDSSLLKKLPNLWRKIAGDSMRDLDQVGISLLVGVVLIMTTDVGRPSVMWVAPFPGFRSKIVQHWRKWPERSQAACISLCPWQWLWCGWHLPVPATTSPQWWTMTWNLELNKHFPPSCLLFQGALSQQRNEVGYRLSP